MSRQQVLAGTQVAEPREFVLAGLKRSYAEGRISIREFERRASGVLDSRTASQLALSAGLAPVAPCARGLGARLVRRVQRLALRAHGVFVAAVAIGSLGLWELAGGRDFWPALLIVPALAFFAMHAYLSRRLSASLKRRRWDL